MAEIGQVIDDKYEILKLIGKGGMSKVYLAMDKRLNKQWAIKEIQKRARDKNNEVVVQSAIAEANMIKQLDHPSIVRIVDIIEDAQVIYIIEDYIEGETLSSIIENNGAQSQDLVIEWAMQICEALEYLHTRRPPIIYRDMKPANVMLSPDGNIKIIDFGIAREYKEKSLSDTVSLGTKGYAAPEQFGGKGQTDARTDIYCLGVTLYHMVTGKNPCEPPYELYPIRHWNPQLSAGLEAIIQKCTQLNPSDRYQTCAELLYALHHYEEYGAAYRKKQKHKLAAFIAASAACVLFAAVGVFGLAMRTHTNNADYTQRMAAAEKAATSDEKIAEYSAAIDIKPLELQPYYGWINAIEADRSFTKDEEAKFLSKVKENIVELKAQNNYADLAYEIGNMYWLFYDYGADTSTDNRLTKTISAMQWFKDAADIGTESYENYSRAKIYYEIGSFNEQIELDVEKASDKGKYKPYWENIKSCIGMITEDDNELVRLETYRLATYGIENYVRKFKADGVLESDIMDIYNQIYEVLSKNRSDKGYIDNTSDKAAKVKSELLQRFGLVENDGTVSEQSGGQNSVLSAVENAYRE